MTRHALALHGSAPRPLAGYLKALAVLRIVARQADPTATGHWGNDFFVLTSRLDEQALNGFLLNDWQPSPIIAPWNGGSGFWPKDNATASDTLTGDVAARFMPLRNTLIQARAAVAALSGTDSPKDATKNAFIARLRATLPDDALDWLDAAVLLTEDGSRYPPLLGTGGNDGRLDFTNNFHQRLLDLFDPASGAPTAKARAWLDGCLHGTAVGDLKAVAIGQFSPGSAGGPNATTGLEADSLVNPWDFVLMLEGALTFAASATRRLEGAGRVGLSYPFTVQPTGGGSGAVALPDEGPARAEMWLPLWTAPASWPDVRHLFAEGRATVGRGGAMRSARDGLDFARAVATLGVARGINSFQRVGFLMRSGKAYLATPLGRVDVREKVEARLIDQLDRNSWLSQMLRLGRDAKAPARVQSLTRRLMDALFKQATRGGPAAVQDTLIVLGDIILACARSPSLRELPPPPDLGPEWVAEADDGSPAFRVACALASLDGSVRMIRHMAPLRLHHDPPKFIPDSHAVTWSRGALTDNVEATLRRRLLDMDWDAESGRIAPLYGHCPASLADIVWFLGDSGEDARINALVPGLSLVQRWPTLKSGADAVAPIAFALMKPVFTPSHALRQIGVLKQDQRLVLPPQVVALLAAGRAPDALRLAGQKLRGVGLVSPFASQTMTMGADGPRLLAALSVPMDVGGRRAVLKTAFPAIKPANGA